MTSHAAPAYDDSDLSIRCSSFWFCPMVPRRPLHWRERPWPIRRPRLRSVLSVGPASPLSRCQPRPAYPSDCPLSLEAYNSPTWKPTEPEIRPDCHHASVRAGSQCRATLLNLTDAFHHVGSVHSCSSRGERLGRVSSILVCCGLVAHLPIQPRPSWTMKG